VPRYAGFLRAINVGGHRVTNEELRSGIEWLGFADVATFRASGNVIFDGREGDRPEKVAAALERGLAESLGYDVPVFLRTATEIRTIAAQEPFPAKQVKASGGKLQALLMRKRLPAQTRRKVLAMATDTDPLVFGDRELYWLPSGPMMDSALDLKSIDALIGPNTKRTKGTLDQIAARYFAD
jgi:uncharacterized protein (DUF1697 family)